MDVPKIAVAERFNPQGVTITMRRSCVEEVGRDGRLALDLDYNETHLLFMDLDAALKAMDAERKLWPSG